MNILVQGTRPFRLERRIDDMDFPAGDVRVLDEEPDADPGETAEAGDQARSVCRPRGAGDGLPARSRDLTELDAYEMASTIAFDLDAKQELLELRSETERLRRLASLCSEALERLDYAEKAARRAQSNGKVHGKDN